MRVICIDDKPHKESMGKIFVKEGEEYEVYQSFRYENCYSVVGLEHCSGSCFTDHYFKKRFIPLSNIDETELVNEKILVENGNK